MLHFIQIFRLSNSKLYTYKFKKQLIEYCIYRTSFAYNIAIQFLQIFYSSVLRAEIVTTFGSKMVTISTRSTKTENFCELRKAIFSVFYNISRLNLGILILLKGSFREVLFCLDLLRSKISLL